MQQQQTKISGKASPNFADCEENKWPVSCCSKLSQNIWNPKDVKINAYLHDIVLNRYFSHCLPLFLLAFGILCPTEAYWTQLTRKSNWNHQINAAQCIDELKVYLLNFIKWNLDLFNWTQENFESNLRGFYHSHKRRSKQFLDYMSVSFFNFVDAVVYHLLLGRLGWKWWTIKAITQHDRGRYMLPVTAVN